jgi:hypothetical protein
MYLTYGNLGIYRLFLHEVVLGVPFVQWDDGAGRTIYARAGDNVDAAARQGVAFYAPPAASKALTAIHEWVDAASGVRRYEATSPGDAYSDVRVAFYAALEPASGLSPVFRWRSNANDQRTVYSTFDIKKHGYTQDGIAFYAATLDGQQYYDPSGGYVYWVHVRGKNDFGCCDSTNNPTRQSGEKSAEFTLATDPDEAGYEAVVCSPVCGTGGNVVWSGPVEFEPNAPGGKLKLTPKGPR